MPPAGRRWPKRTITNDFGIPIQFYARVDFRGFEELVDQVGGVMVDVDRPVKDDEYPTDNYGYQQIYYAPGPQLLDGVHALQYARSRHGTNDFSRARRQQMVIVALRDRALQLNMLSKAPSMAGIVRESLEHRPVTRATAGHGAAGVGDRSRPHWQPGH